MFRFFESECVPPMNGNLFICAIKYRISNQLRLNMRYKVTFSNILKIILQIIIHTLVPILFYKKNPKLILGIYILLMRFNLLFFIS